MSMRESLSMSNSFFIQPSSRSTKSTASAMFSALRLGAMMWEIGGSGAGRRNRLSRSRPVTLRISPANHDPLEKTSSRQNERTLTQSCSCDNTQTVVPNVRYQVSLRSSAETLLKIWLVLSFSLNSIPVRGLFAAEAITIGQRTNSDIGWKLRPDPPLRDVIDQMSLKHRRQRMRLMR